MRSNWWKVLYRHPTNVFFAGVLWGALFVMIGLYTTQYTDGMRLLDHIPPWLLLISASFFLAAFIVSFVFLLGARFFAALCHLGAAGMMPVSLYALEWLRDDRFVFTGGPHGEIADIYNRRRSEFTLRTNSGPRLVALNDQCNPSRDCLCWIVLDPGHTSGVEQDLGGWDRPTASIVSADDWAEPFAIVDVRRIDADAYSVLSSYGALNSWGNPF
jgi:hypothetical protein